MKPQDSKKRQNSHSLTTTEASKLLNTSARVVRHFCDSGYIPHVRRNHRYQRLLTPAQFELLAVLVEMRQAGFVKSEIKRWFIVTKRNNPVE